MLFYTDTPEFGGHEVLTLWAAEYIAEECGARVDFVFYSGNQRLRRELEQMSAQCRKLHLHPMHFSSGRLQAFRTLFSFRRRAALQRLFKEINPDAVIVSQGRIEGSSMGLLAARQAGIRTISYIPMAHSVKVSGRPILCTLRDNVNRHLYRVPDQFITSSESSKDMLRKRGAACEVEVVRPGIDTSVELPDKVVARERMNLDRNVYIVGIVGRIQFRQKGQDFALRTLSQFLGKLGDIVFCFLGSGPDGDRLKRQVRRLHLSSKVIVLPWHPNPIDVYAALDMLLIPSRFEGVPQVMLEAMAFGLPIIASDVDAMGELLPSSWLFPFGDASALVNTLLRVKTSDSRAMTEKNCKRVLSEYSKHQFQRSFADAVLTSRVPLAAGAAAQLSKVPPLDPHAAAQRLPVTLK